MPRLSALAFCLDNYGFVRHGRFGYNVRTFTGSDTWVCPEGVTEIEYLVVGGGGGGGLGGTASGGGGGGGGVLYGTLSVTAGNSYSVSVGSGGSSGASGGSSSFNSPVLVAAGGGAGGFEPSLNGANGGSGGGGSGGTPGFAGTGGNGNVPATSPPQGNNGGTGSAVAPLYSGGGGGGALTAGGAGADGGRGGTGIFTTISGRSTAYGAGGGAGQSSPGTGGLGGTGGGGAGSAGGSAGSNGATYRGGGGGGAGNASPSAPGGSGGSGIVILRYRQSASSVTRFTSTGYWRCPHNVTSVDFLSIGGGGGGGVANAFGTGGGGGAGLFTYIAGYDRILPGKLYLITIQAGESGAANFDTFGGGDNIATCLHEVDDSTLSTITALDGVVTGGGGQGSSNVAPGTPVANNTIFRGGSSAGGPAGRGQNSYPGTPFTPADAVTLSTKSPLFNPATSGYGAGASATTFPVGGYNPSLGDAPHPGNPGGVYQDNGGGGGGGAGGAGSAATIVNPSSASAHSGLIYGGNGGIGVSTTMTGTTLNLGGGGGGGGIAGGNFPGSVTQAGGGRGAWYGFGNILATSGGVNQGGGGGGGSRGGYGTPAYTPVVVGSYNPGGNGGSGVVIIRTYGL